MIVYVPHDSCMRVVHVYIYIHDSSMIVVRVHEYIHDSSMIVDVGMYDSS